MNLPDLKKLPKKSLFSGAVIVVLACVLLLYGWTLQARLKSTTQITQNLREELETLRKENKIYKDQDESKISQIEHLSTELNTLKEDKTVSATKQEELIRLVNQAEKSLDAQNRKIADLENKLKDAEEKMRRQKKASANLEQQTRSAKSNPGMTQEYVRLVENEWAAAVSKTDELKNDLNKTLSELSSYNQERSKLKNETATMHYNLAVILTEQGNYKAAILEYEKVLETRPNDADAHYNLGILYDDVLKNNEKALEHYRQYVRVAPDAPEAQRVRQWMKDKEIDTTMKFKV